MQWNHYTRALSDHWRSANTIARFSLVVGPLVHIPALVATLTKGFLSVTIESPVLTEDLVPCDSGPLHCLDSSYTTVSLDARSNALHALSRVVCLTADHPAFTEPSLCLSHLGKRRDVSWKPFKLV